MPTSPSMRLFLLGSLIVSSGCHNAAVSSTSSAVTNVRPKDIREADAYRNSLPAKLGLSAEQVIVRAEPGYTRVTILNVHAPSEQQRIAGILQQLNDANPKMNPLKARFK